jgi:hypothetical protein
MGKTEWKALVCDVDNLETSLNWLEASGFEIYEVYPATEADSEDEGSKFLVLASRAGKLTLVKQPREVKEIKNVPRKSRSGSCENEANPQNQRARG